MHENFGIETRALRLSDAFFIVFVFLNFLSLNLAEPIREMRDNEGYVCERHYRCSRAWLYILFM